MQEGQSMDAVVSMKQGGSFADKLVRYGEQVGLGFEKISPVEDGLVIAKDTMGEVEAYWDTNLWRLKSGMESLYEEEQGKATAAGIGHARLDINAKISAASGATLEEASNDIKNHLQQILERVS